MELRRAGYPRSEIACAGFSEIILRAASLKVRGVRIAGASTTELLRAGYEASEVIDTGHQYFEGLFDQTHTRPTGRISTPHATAPPPTPPSLVSLPPSLASLPDGVHQGEPFTCAICMEDVEEGMSTRRLGCLHAYHAGCIDRWLCTGHRRCPLCNADPITGLPRGLEQPARRSAEL